MERKADAIIPLMAREKKTSSGDQTTPKFPKGFLWGASVSSHQVEGGTDNQWDRWEREHADQSPAVTRLLLNNLKNWPELRGRAAIPDTYICGQAVDHYHRYAEDFKLLQSFNMNAFRFSIEWSRIEPRPGEWNRKEIEYYRKYLNKLQAMGITPFVTLWHFTIPTWFADMGGFDKRSNITYFTRYVAKITEELGDMFRYVITLNEPDSYTAMGYLRGFWPPQVRNIFTARRVYENLQIAHQQAYAIVKAHSLDIQIGTSLALTVDKLESQSIIAKLSLRFTQRIAKRWFLDSEKMTADFVGLNFYMTNYYSWLGSWTHPPEPNNDLGWYMEPGAIEELLVDIYARYQRPIYVTENGLADAHDQYRQWWIQETIKAMGGALDKGVDLRGYLHWSLLDNFEWAFGWLAEFGLVHVDRATMKRTVRPSARWFGERIAELRAESNT
jgi:beta-glucosidase